MEIVAQIALAGLLIILVTFVAVVAWCVFEVLHEQFIEWRQRRLARIEAELDQKSERLRSTILGLAEDLRRRPRRGIKGTDQGDVPHHRHQQAASPLSTE